MATDVGSAYGKIVIDSDTSGIDKIGGALNRLGGLTMGVAAGMSAALVGAAGAVAGAVAGVAVSGAKMAMDLEAQMSDIQAVMLASVDEVEQLKDLIIDLGLDPSLKVSTEEAAAAIGMLGRNGVTVTEVLNGMARSTVLLANATGADFAVAANIATDVMNLWKIEAADVITAVDQIVAVTTNSKFSINDFALALAQGGGVAATVGMELQDFTAGIVAISPLFASGSDAGTSFKTMLQRLVPQSEKAKGAIAELGLEFFNADGSMKDLAEIAGQLNEAFYGTSEAFVEVGGRTAEQNAELERLQKLYNSTLLSIQDYTTGVKGAGMTEEARAKKLETLREQLANIEGQMIPLEGIQGEMIKTVRQLTEEERNFYLTTIFGSDAMRAAAGLAEYTEEEFRALLETMGETDAAEAARIRMDNLKGSLEILDGVIEALKLRIGDVFIDTFRAVVEEVTSFLEANEEKIVGFFERVRENLQIVADAVLGFWRAIKDGQDPLSAFTDALQKLNVPQDIIDRFRDITERIGEFIERVAEFVTEHKDELIGALAGIAAVLAGSVIATLITAIGTAIAALATPITALLAAGAVLGAAWAGNWLGIRDKVTEAWERIRPVLETLKQWLETDVAEALREARYFFDRFFERIAAGEEPLSAFIGILRQMGVPPEVTAKIRGLADGIQTVREKIEEAGGILRSLGQYFGFIIQEGDPLNDFLVDLPKPLQPLIRLFGEALAAVRETIGGIVAFFQEQGSKIGAWFSENSELINDYIAVISRNLAVVIGVLAAVFAVIVREGARAWVFIEPLLSGIVDLLLGLAKTAMQIATGDWAGAWETIQQTAVAVGDALKGFLRGLAEWVTGWFGTTWEQVMEVWSRNGEMLSEIFSIIGGNVQENFQEMVDELKSELQAISDWWTTGWENLVTGIEDAWTNIKTRVSENFQAMVDQLKSELRAIADWWTNGWNNLATGLSTAWENIKTAVSNGLQAVGDFFTNAWESIVTGIALAWEGITAAVGNGMTALQEFLSAAWDGIVAFILNQLRDFFNKMGLSFDEMVARWALIWMDIQLIAATVWDRIKVAVAEKIAELMTAIQEQTDAIKTAVTTKWEEIKTSIQTKWDEIKTAVQTKVTEVTTALNAKWDEVKTAVSTKWNEIKSSIESAWEDIKSAVGTKVTEVLTALNTKWEEIKTAVTTKWNEIKTALQNVWTSIVQSVTQKADDTKRTVDNKVQETKQSWIEKWNEIKQALVDKWNEMVQTVTTKVEEVKEEISTGIENALLAIREFITPFLEAGVDLIQGVIDGAMTLFETVRETVSGIFNNALTAVTETIGQWTSIGADIIQGILNGIMGGAGDVINFITGLAESAISSIKEKLGIQSPSKVFHEIGGQIMQGLAEGVIEGGPAAVGGVGLVIGQIIDETVGQIPALIGRVIDEVGTGVPLIIGRIIDEVERQQPGVVEVIKRTTEEMVQTIRDILSGAAIDVEGLFKIGGGVVSFMSATASRFQERQLNPLREEIERYSESLNKVFDKLDIDKDISPADLMKELAKARMMGDTERERGIRQLIGLQGKRNGLELEYQKQQEKLLQLQKQQQDLAFLKSQLDFLTMITEAGLNPADILGGIELGLNANLDDLMQAMSIAMQAIIGQAEDELGISSPSKVFTDMFRQVIAGSVKGLENLRPITDAMRRMTDTIKNTPIVPDLSRHFAGAMAGMVPQLTVNPVIQHHQPRPVNFYGPVRIGADDGSNLLDMLDPYQNRR